MTSNSTIWVPKPYLFRAWQYRITLNGDTLICGATPNIKRRKSAYKAGVFTNPDLTEFVGNRVSKIKMEILQVMTFETEEGILEVGKQEMRNIQTYKTHGRFNMTLGGIPPRALRKWYEQYNYTILMQSCSNPSLKYEYDVREAAVELGVTIKYLLNKADGFYSRKKNGWYLRKKYKNTPYPEDLRDVTRQGLVRSKPIYLYRVADGTLFGSYGSHKEVARLLDISTTTISKHIEYPGSSIKGFVVSKDPVTPAEVKEYLTTNKFVAFIEKTAVVFNKYEVIRFSSDGAIIATYANTKEAERLTGLSLRGKIPFTTVDLERFVYRKDLL